MKVPTWIVTLAALALVIIVPNACTHGCKSGTASRHGGTRSHNAGRTCQECHVADGPGEGCWAIAGTAYDTLSGQVATDVTMRLSTLPGDSGELRATVEGDAKGNFYTSDDPHFGNGLYPSVTSASGRVSRMLAPVLNGECNGCHGVSTPHIQVRS